MSEDTDSLLFPFESVDAGETLLAEYGHLLDAPLPPGDGRDVDATVLEFLDYATRAHALAVVGQLICRDEALRFSDFQERLKISPKTLSTRLSDLVDQGFAVRRSYDEMPPRVEYELTPKARDLRPVFRFLYGWAATYDLEAWDGEK